MQVLLFFLISGSLKLTILTVKAFGKCPWPFLIIGGVVGSFFGGQYLLDTPNRIQAEKDRQERIEQVQAQKIDRCISRRIKMRNCPASPIYQNKSAWRYR